MRLFDGIGGVGEFWWTFLFFDSSRKSRCGDGEKRKTINDEFVFGFV